MKGWAAVLLSSGADGGIVILIGRNKISLKKNMHYNDIIQRLWKPKQQCRSPIADGISRELYDVKAEYFKYD